MIVCALGHLYTTLSTRINASKLVFQMWCNTHHIYIALCERRGAGISVRARAWVAFQTRRRRHAGDPHVLSAQDTQKQPPYSRWFSTDLRARKRRMQFESQRRDARARIVPENRVAGQPQSPPPRQQYNR